MGRHSGVSWWPYVRWLVRWYSALCSLLDSTLHFTPCPMQLARRSQQYIKKRAGLSVPCVSGHRHFSVANSHGYKRACTLVQAYLLTLCLVLCALHPLRQDVPWLWKKKRNGVLPPKPQNGCSRLGVATLLPWVPWTLGLQSIPIQAYKCGSVDFGIAVHSINMQTDKEPFRIIHAHQFFNQPIAKVVYNNNNNSAQYLLGCNVVDNTRQHICLVPLNRQTIPSANSPEFTQHPLMHGAILHRCGKRCIHIILKPS